MTGQKIVFITGKRRPFFLSCMCRKKKQPYVRSNQHHTHSQKENTFNLKVKRTTNYAKKLQIQNRKICIRTDKKRENGQRMQADNMWWRITFTSITIRAWHQKSIASVIRRKSLFRVWCQKSMANVWHHKYISSVLLRKSLFCVWHQKSVSSVWHQKSTFSIWCMKSISAVSVPEINYPVAGILSYI